MAETQRFGLTKTPDNDVLDRILAQLEEHRHAGQSIAGLGDPSTAPTAAVATTGGTLGNGVDLYYRASFVDENGLETLASDELSVPMPAIPSVDDEPVLTGATGAESTLEPDTYFYALTANSDAGETALGPQSIITVVPGQNQVDVTLPDLPAGASSFNVWREKVGELGWTKVGAAVSATTWSDVGYPAEDRPTDPATQPPDTNTGTATNSVTITCPDAGYVGADPSPVVAWRIYRTTVSGVYGDTSLLAQVVDTTTDTGGPLLTTFVDIGTDTVAGAPNETSTALHPSRPVVLPHGDTLPSDLTGLVDYTPFLLDDGDIRELYALIGGTWELVSGGGGGGDADVILAAPDGSRWKLVVDDTGTLSTVRAPASFSLQIPADGVALPSPTWTTTGHALVGADNATTPKLVQSGGVAYFDGTQAVMDAAGIRQVVEADIVTPQADGTPTLGLLLCYAEAGANMASVWLTINNSGIDLTQTDGTGNSFGPAMAPSNGGWQIQETSTVRVEVSDSSGSWTVAISQNGAVVASGTLTWPPTGTGAGVYLADTAALTRWTVSAAA